LACIFSISCSQKELSKEESVSEENEPPTSKFEVIDTYKESDKLVADENHPDAKTIRQDLEDARRVASILQDEGFESQIYKPQEGFPAYELISKKKMLLEVKAVIDLTTYLSKLAEDNNGEMTGWGAPIEN